MYLVCKPGGGISLSHFTLSRRDIRWVDLFGTIARNVPKERLVRLYLNIYPQNVPTAQMKVTVSENRSRTCEINA